MSTEILKLMVRGAYDLQKLRVQTGLRLCANFRAKLKVNGAEEEEPEDGELGEDAKKVVDLLKASYVRLTDGVARNRTLPTEKGFRGDELISEYDPGRPIHPAGTARGDAFSPDDESA